MAERTWIETLMFLAREGAVKGSAKISSSWLSKRLGVSRQTAIRRLAELESQGLITRRVEPSGQTIHISPTGISALRALQKELETILKSTSSSFRLSGKVATGMGEGSYYISRPGYMKQFNEELGFNPYPGTLDIKLEGDSIDIKETLMRLTSIQLFGFETSERTFGPVKIFRAKIGNLKGAVVLPNRSHHTDVLEVVAPMNLRKAMELKDGDVIEVEVFL